MTPTDSKLSKDLHRTYCFYATKCVYVCWCGYTWENWGSCESNYSKNKLKTWWNKQQTSWLQAIAHTVWLITFNDKLFDQCHVYEWTDWWFLAINKPGCLEKRSRGELWGSVETYVVRWVNSWVAALKNTLVCQEPTRMNYCSFNRLRDMLLFFISPKSRQSNKKYFGHL